MDKGSQDWNDEMYQLHPTPYHGIAGFIQRRRLQRILSVIRSSKIDKPHIVEVGCESGMLLAFLHQQLPQAQFTGLDISPAALATAKQHLPKDISLYQYDLCESPPTNLPTPDILICSETLEHIPDAETAIQHLAQIAGPHTKVILTVPIEQYKNQIKTMLIRLGLFDLLFKGIEKQLSEWHVHDFGKQDFVDLVEPHFQVEQYDKIWWMHQMIVGRLKN